MDGEAIDQAAQQITRAHALLIGAGAGMGVDSGLPDFRGDEGFWRAYPPFKSRGLSFVDMANPMWFDEDPSTAWGFYGHRLHLYRNTEPHDGFRLLAEWGEKTTHGAFVFTSNVDGQFQQAGFDPNRVVECHGSLNHLQCASPCGSRIWSAEETQVEVNETTFRANPPLPACPLCGGVARPNVLMFGDGGWLSERTATQEQNLRMWLGGIQEGLVVIEMGAGTAVPTVRWTCERTTAQYRDGVLVRINPREPDGPPGTISIASGALEALCAIDKRLG